MNLLILRAKFPRLLRKYLTHLRFVYHLRPVCYTFGKPNDITSPKLDMPMRDSATAYDALPTTVSPHPLPPAEIGQGVTRCFSHSEMWCYCCCSKPGGAY